MIYSSERSCLACQSVGEERESFPSRGPAFISYSFCPKTESRNRIACVNRTYLAVNLSIFISTNLNFRSYGSIVKCTPVDDSWYQSQSSEIKLKRAKPTWMLVLSERSVIEAPRYKMRAPIKIASKRTLVRFSLGLVSDRGASLGGLSPEDFLAHGMR